MGMNSEQLKKAADFAMLNITEGENQSFCAQIGEVLALADKLNDLDTDGVEPTTHPNKSPSVLRQDIVKPSYKREEILKNVPSQENGYIKVPKVME